MANGRAVVGVLAVGVAAAFTAVAIYPLYVVRRPDQVVRREDVPQAAEALQKKSMWGEMKR
jgi:hypothetical protein